MDEREQRELKILMASLRGRLEAMHLGNGRGIMSREDKTHSPRRGDLTNLPLLELLQK